MREESKFCPIISLFTNSSSNNTYISTFKNLSLNYQSEHQIDFTHVDCLETDFCATTVQILEFPSIYIIQGPNFLYWRKLSINNWTYEINNIVNFNKPILLTNKNELINLLQEVKNGGSLFQLTIQPKFKAVFRFFCQFIKYYRIYNSSFAYSYDENIQAATITCYYSNKCFNKRRIRPNQIESFFEANKFSFYHTYHQNELREFISINPFAFVIYHNQSQLIYSKDSIFDQFGFQCQKFKFGFIDSNRSREFIKTFSLENLSQPFVFAINIFKDCYATFPVDANESFYNNVYNGVNCTSVGNKFGLFPQKPKTNFQMSSFVITFALVFGLFYCITTSKRDDPFLEHQYGHKYDYQSEGEEEDNQAENHIKID